MSWFFGKKKEYEKLRDEVQDSFDHVKQDFSKVGEWIKHFDGKHIKNETEINEIKEQLFQIKEEISSIKDTITFFKPQTPIPPKQQTTMSDKQSVSDDVQTVAQTSVQSDILYNLTVMERGIIWALINSDMKLSYEDLAALLGKDKSTIRGQVNNIRQKNNGLIEEFRELTGKKRIFIPIETRNKIIKTIKPKINFKNK